MLKNWQFIGALVILYSLMIVAMIWHVSSATALSSESSGTTITIFTLIALLGIVAIGFIVKLRDTSQKLQRKVEKYTQSLSQIKSELQQSNDAMEEFCYVASHDLQEPLRTITSYLELLQVDVGESLSNIAEEDMGFISGGVQRMTDIVQALLLYSRAGRFEFGSETVDLSNCMECVTFNLKNTLAEVNGRLEWDDLPVVTGDATQLTRVFQNLVNNSLKFHSKQAPVVKVSAQSRDQKWKITVSDNGIGMEPENLEQIFAPFKRLHGLGKYSGSGIGLAIVRKIIERHGGEIHADSRPGEGSRFHVTLPI